MPLYHGSKTPGLTTLNPFPHEVVGGDAVVFATTDIRFALAMIYGTSKELDIGYNINMGTGEERFYIQELVPNAFELLSAPGYVYEVEDSGFHVDSRLSHTELASEYEARVVKETRVESVLAELKGLDVEFVSFSL